MASLTFRSTETPRSATGIASQYTQDYVYGVNRTSGKVVFKHTLPPNSKLNLMVRSLGRLGLSLHSLNPHTSVYIDNLEFDWIEDRLFSIAFRPNGP